VVRFRVMKVLGAILLGLVMCVGAEAKPTSLAKKHSTRLNHTAARSKSSARTGNRAVTARGTHVVASTTVVRRGRGARVKLAVRRTRYQERFTASSFADNLTLGDVVAGEDPVVRAAAIEALGNMNGTAVAIDPSTGRILAMVNQKLALSNGAEPCSTIKLTVALAALEEGIVRRDTPVNLGGRFHLTMTEALAHSNNLYFETLGRTLGFERVKHYANEFGLGELAGYRIQGEQLGTYPDEVLPASLGGVGRMCSFGESVSMTPLQLGALVSAIANGGTLYYLQHPESPEDIATFEPRVKRSLNIAPLIPEIKDGMEGAVEYGTARSLRANFRQFPVMGKTGTCSNNGTRFGWFGSYADTPRGRIVTVFFLEGGRPTFGPKAAELTGQFYRALWDKSYFMEKSQPVVASGAGSIGTSE
jgi:penicillin-binding protein 2